jgi:hypothetical protein
MKKNLKTLLVSLIVVLFAFSIFVLALGSVPPCVVCVPAPPGWMCQGTSGIGGEACITQDRTCTLVDTCSPNPDFVGRESECLSKVLEYSPVSVPDNIIRDIARFNPHAALALIRIRNLKLEFTQGKVNFAPVELTKEDVEKHLTLPESSDYFEEIRAKVRDIFTNKQEPIVYEFVLNKDGANPSLHINAINSTYSSSSFEINLSRVSFGRDENESTRFEATSWKIN